SIGVIAWRPFVWTPRVPVPARTRSAFRTWTSTWRARSRRLFTNRPLSREACRAIERMRRPSEFPRHEAAAALSLHHHDGARRRLLIADAPAARGCVGATWPARGLRARARLLGPRSVVRTAAREAPRVAESAGALRAFREETASGRMASLRRRALSEHIQPRRRRHRAEQHRSSAHQRRRSRSSRAVAALRLAARSALSGAVRQSIADR